MRPIVITFVALSAFSSNALAQQTTQPYYHDHMWGGWHAWYIGPIMMIVFIGLVVASIILLVRRLGGPAHRHVLQPHGLPVKTPLDILKERFAKGEIDKDEFEEKRSILEQHTNQ